MKTPRITPEHATLLERMAGSWPARFGTAIGAVAISLLLATLVASSVEKYGHILIYFTAILLTSVLAGLGPGLLATGLAAVAIHLAPPDHLSAHEFRLLVVEGILVSIVGGIVRSARMKSRDRLAANVRLEQQVLEVGDDERRRIGLDLHDGLGQHLTGISLLSETMAQQIAAGAGPNPATIESITRLASESVRITRDLAKSLSPVTLERDGLVAAIEELASASSALLGVQCTPECDDEDMPLDRTRALHVYRIAQEAVNNSVRHGKAKNVKVCLNWDDKELRLTVADDGSGLSMKTTTNPGIGLRIMQYRARILGATLTAERAGPEGGTIVTCTCPMNGSKKRS